MGRTATKKKPAAKKKATKATGRAKKENRPRSIPPHPRYPDVEKLPYKWQPGSRGRPPSGWGKDKDGNPVPGKGWRKIAGKWHKPMDTKAVKKSAAKKSAAKKSATKRKAAPKKKKTAPKKSAAKRKAPAKKATKRKPAAKKKGSTRRRK